MKKHYWTNIAQTDNHVNRKVGRLGEGLIPVRSPEMGQRLGTAITEIWGSQRACAESLGLTEAVLSRYVQGRWPAGENMALLAQALPGKIEWILTGRQPTATQQLAALMEPLAPEDQQSVIRYTHLLRGVHSPIVHALVAMVDALLTWPGVQEHL